MIKFIREMFPPNACKFEVKKHIPTKCGTVHALFYRSDSSAYVHASSS